MTIAENAAPCLAVEQLPERRKKILAENRHTETVLEEKEALSITGGTP